MMKQNKFRETEAYIIIRRTLLIALISALFGAASYAGAGLSNPIATLVISLVVFVTGLNFTVSLCKKSGTGLIFCTIFSLSTFWLNDFGIMGTQKILIFLSLGVIFELFSLGLGKRHFMINKILSISASSGFLYPLAFLIISGKFSSFLQLGLLNLTLLVTGIALITSIIFNVLWINIRTSKVLLKLELEMSR